MESGTQNRNVLKFHARAGVPQHQSTPADIPTSNESRRKQKTFAENLEKRSGIIRTCDAAKQYVRAIARMFFQKDRAFCQRISK